MTEYISRFESSGSFSSVSFCRFPELAEHQPYKFPSNINLPREISGRQCVYTQHHIMGIQEPEPTTAGLRRRGCSYQKGDFLPEESFQTWENYTAALKQTPHRLIDRLFTRSGDQAELDAKAKSQTAMKKTLTWWDLMWFGMGAVIGAGIFVLTGLEANQDAGPAVVLSYVVSGASALMSVFCYTEFAVEIPVAGFLTFSYFLDQIFLESLLLAR